MQRALGYADKALAGGVPAAVAGTAGVAVVALGLAGALALPGLVTIAVQNANCEITDLPSAGLLDLLPGVQVPEDLTPGGEATITLPRLLARGDFSVDHASRTVTIRALGRDIPLQAGGLDLSASTWNGTPLSRFERPVSVAAQRTNRLVLVCR